MQVVHDISDYLGKNKKEMENNELQKLEAILDSIMVLFDKQGKCKKDEEEAKLKDNKMILKSKIIESKENSENKLNKENKDIKENKDMKDIKENKENKENKEEKEKKKSNNTLRLSNFVKMEIIDVA